MSPPSQLPPPPTALVFAVLVGPRDIIPPSDRVRPWGLGTIEKLPNLVARLSAAALALFANKVARTLFCAELFKEADDGFDSFFTVLIDELFEEMLLFGFRLTA